MCFCFRTMGRTIATLLLLAASMPSAQGQDKEDPSIVAVRKSAESLTAAFNAGKVDALAAVFLPQGELIDEEGTVDQGQAEIKGLPTAFFGKFPGAKLSNDVESVRLVGPVAIEEGTRSILLWVSSSKQKPTCPRALQENTDGKIAILQPERLPAAFSH